MDVMDDKLGQILKALSRTNSGADSYNKVVELFGLGGQFLVKPAALRNRPTKILFSEEAQKCIVECYNNYEVVFLDENFSPLTGKKNIVMVETRLIEVIDLGLDVDQVGLGLEVVDRLARQGHLGFVVADLFAEPSGGH